MTVAGSSVVLFLSFLACPTIGYLDLQTWSGSLLPWGWVTAGVPPSGPVHSCQEERTILFSFFQRR